MHPHAPSHGEICSRLSSRCIHMLLPMARSALLSPFLHLMDSLEKSLRKNHLRVSNPHHVVSRVFASSFTGSTEVVVITDYTLVAVSLNWLLFTGITGNTWVNMRLL